MKNMYVWLYIDLDIDDSDSSNHCTALVSRSQSAFSSSFSYILPVQI